MKAKITEITRSQYSIQILNTLFDCPILSTTNFIEISKIPRANAMRMIELLRQNNILLPLRKGRGRQASILMFKELIEIINRS